MLVKALGCDIKVCHLTEWTGNQPREDLLDDGLASSCAGEELLIAFWVDPCWTVSKLCFRRPGPPSLRAHSCPGRPGP